MTSPASALSKSCLNSLATLKCTVSPSTCFQVGYTVLCAIRCVFFLFCGHFSVIQTWWKKWHVDVGASHAHGDGIVQGHSVHAREALCIPLFLQLFESAVVVHGVLELVSFLSTNTCFGFTVFRVSVKFTGTPHHTTLNPVRWSRPFSCVPCHFSMMSSGACGRGNICGYVLRFIRGGAVLLSEVYLATCTLRWVWDRTRTCTCADPRLSCVRLRAQYRSPRSVCGTCPDWVCDSGTIPWSSLGGAFPW